MQPSLLRTKILAVTVAPSCMQSPCLGNPAALGTISLPCSSHPHGFQPARAPRHPATEARQYGDAAALTWHRGRRCLGWSTGAALWDVLQHHGKLQGRNHLCPCSFSLGSGQSSEQSYQSTSTTAFDHGKLKVLKTISNSRPIVSDMLVSRKMGNNIPPI